MDTEKLIAKGYMPKELPPCFTSIPLGNRAVKIIKQINCLRACLQSQEPDADAGDVDHGHEVSVELFIACGNPSELLDPVEETLDEVAVLVPVPVVLALLDPVASRRDDWLGPEGADLVDEAVGVVALVRDHPLGAEALQQRRGLGDVGLLAGGEQPAHRVAQRVGGRVDFRRQPPAGAPDSLWTVFFRAPAPCWWTRTTVLSGMNSSRSASPHSDSAICFQTPFFVRR